MVTSMDDTEMNWENETSLQREIIIITNRTKSIRIPCQLKLSTMNIILMVCFTIIFTLSVIGNCLVIVTIAQNRWMRTVTNIFLQSMAISDLLLSVICMPPTLTAMLFQCFLWGRAMCKLFTYLQPVSVAASAYTLVAIALERYNAICRPLHSRHWKTKSHAIKVITVVWACALACAAPSLFVYDLAQIQPGQWNCRDDWGAMKELSGFYYLFLLLVLFVVPLVLMVGLYSAVTYTLWMGIKLDSTPSNGDLSNGFQFEDQSSNRFPAKIFQNQTSCSTPVRLLRLIRQSIGDRTRFNRSSKKNRAFLNGSMKSAWSMKDSTTETIHSKISNTTTAGLLGGIGNGPILRSTHTAKNLEAKKRVIIMLFAVVAEFLICWSPLYMYQAMRYLGYTRINPHLAGFFVILAYLSSCSNPITYCFLNLKFRQAFLLAFGCRFMVDEAQYKYGGNTRTMGINARNPNLHLRRYPPVGNGDLRKEESGEQQRVIDSVVVQCHEQASASLAIPVVQLRVSSVENSSRTKKSNDELYDSDDEEEEEIGNGVVMEMEIEMEEKVEIISSL